MIARADARRSEELALPQVTLHYAQSLDGRIGLGRGSERAILSSDEGFSAAHYARSQHDAVLVGIETVLQDDPRLTARGEVEAQPLRVVLDSELRLPLHAQLLRGDANAGQVVVVGVGKRALPERRSALESAGAMVTLTSGDADQRVSLTEALWALAALGVRRLLVEGGAKVQSSFLKARLADRAQVEIAPIWLGSTATAAACELGVSHLPLAPRLERIETGRLGENIIVRGDIVYPERGADVDS
jgi:riboflavin-specific deaminase-like protein